MPWLCVGVFTGKALKQRQGKLEGGAWYVNEQCNVDWERVYRGVGECTLGVQIFLI